MTIQLVVFETEYISAIFSNLKFTTNRLTLFPYEVAMSRIRQIRVFSKITRIAREEFPDSWKVFLVSSTHNSAIYIILFFKERELASYSWNELICCTISLLA